MTDIDVTRPMVQAQVPGVYLFRDEATMAALKGHAESPLLTTGHRELIQRGAEPPGCCPVCWQSTEDEATVSTPLGDAVHVECARCWTCREWIDEGSFVLPARDDGGEDAEIFLHAKCFNAAYILKERWRPGYRRNVRGKGRRRPAPGRYLPRADPGTEAFRAEFPAGVIWSPYMTSVFWSVLPLPCCAICHFVDPEATGFTNRLETPVHSDCASCPGCGKPVTGKPAVWLSFADDRVIQFFDVVMHERCFTRLYEPIPAT